MELLLALQYPRRLPIGHSSNKAWCAELEGAEMGFHLVR